SGVRIELYRPSTLTATATMLAQAFATNPLHVAAFGTDAIASNEAFFRVGLAVMKGQRYVATAGGRPIGFVHWVAWPSCRFTPSEKLRMLPEMMTGLGLGASWRLTRWLSAWSSLDPA